MTAPQEQSRTDLAESWKEGESRRLQLNEGDYDFIPIWDDEEHGSIQGAVYSGEEDFIGMMHIIRTDGSAPAYKFSVAWTPTSKESWVSPNREFFIDLESMKELVELTLISKFKGLDGFVQAQLKQEDAS